MRFAICTLAACLVVGTTASSARAEFPPPYIQHTVFAIGVYMLILMVLGPVVGVILLIMSFFAKTPAPPPHRKGPAPSTRRAAHDDA